MSRGRFERNPIRNILIIGRGGVCLASATEEAGSQLVGGIISAMVSLGRDIVGSELESLDFKGENVYCVVNKEGVCVVAISSEELPKTLITFILEDILDKFMSEYGGLLRSWDGNLKVFEGARSYLRDVISKPFMETAMHVFFSRAGLEGLILYDLKKGKSLFSILPAWFRSRRRMATAAMIANFANKLSEEVKGGKVDAVVFGGREKWTVVLVRDTLCLMYFLDRKDNNVGNVVELSKLLLDFALKMVEEEGSVSIAVKEEDD
ncbi:MAG: hypothetical protein QXW47_03045 [Candidatus Jordarchaeales archaeon]